MRRAKARAEESDVVIVVLSFESESSNGEVAVRLDPEVVETAARLVEEKDNVLVVINKTDTVQHQDPDHFEAALAATQAAIPGLSRSKTHLISCTTAIDAEQTSKSTPDNDSIQHFLRALIEQFTTPPPANSPHTNDSEADPSIWQESLGATERHRLLLETCIASLEDFTALVETATEDQDGEADIVLAAEFLRDAGDSLARITGRGEAGDVEEVLGVVFEKFCVGK
jgi:tRNA modification GTPase